MQSVRKKLKLLNINNNRKEKYSDKWLLKINPLAIAKYIQRKNVMTLIMRESFNILILKILMDNTKVTAIVQTTTMIRHA